MSDIEVSEQRYAVVGPEGRWVGAPVRRQVAQREVGRRRIGFVWDHVFRGDEMFKIIEEELRARDPDLTFAGYEVFGDIHGRDEGRVMADLPERLRAEDVDAVVVGVGA